MDAKKITEAIKNGFGELAKNLGITNKTEEEKGKKAVNTFVEQIVNAIEEAMPTQESITEMVNTALEANAENDAKGIEEAINAKTKDFVNKKDLEATVENLTEAVTKELGNGSGKEKTKEKTNTSSVKPANRFSGRKWFADAE